MVILEGSGNSSAFVRMRFAAAMIFPAAPRHEVVLISVPKLDF